MEHINWDGFKSGAWKDTVDVRDFIQKNYKEYKGDASFLAGPTARTKELMKKVEALLAEDPNWADYRLGIKLHPRENNGVVEMYQKAFPKATVYDNASQLYTLLAESFVQLTVSSTSLYEAAEFDTPTVSTYFEGQDPERIFGFPVWTMENPEQAVPMLEKLRENENYSRYLQYLKEQSIQYN